MIFICNYDLFGYDRVWYTIKNRCLEETEMDYEDGAVTLVLYTRGTRGKISIVSFCYMENTDHMNDFRRNGGRSEAETGSCMIS